HGYDPTWYRESMFRANIGIRDGVISKIARKRDIKAERVIDARGQRGHTRYCGYPPPHRFLHNLE
ncbi:hypothetical protein KEJ49_07535, partial [Candidatus Bathyarchaeota archaeon]|nr:hypothetical protein [Candidatus Bathyarchaeota archaeon]